MNQGYGNNTTRALERKGTGFKSLKKSVEIGFRV
jgi:hypothetical protein